MSTRLIIEGNAVYEIDEECEKCMKKKMPGGRTRKQEEKETSKGRETKPEKRT